MPDKFQNKYRIPSARAKGWNLNDLTFGWQERFHDHVVRDDNELCRIREYIKNNPLNWKG